LRIALPNVAVLIGADGLASVIGAREDPVSEDPTCSSEMHPPPIAQRQPDYRLLAISEKTVLRLVPSVAIMTTAAMAISAAISPYSIAVTPCSLSINRGKDSRLRIISSPIKVRSGECVTDALSGYAGAELYER